MRKKKGISMKIKSHTYPKKEKSTEMKQVFLSNAISDISNCIQLTDTKVSIIMGALVALIAGFLACNDSIKNTLQNIKPYSWIGVCIIIFTILSFISLISVFVFGILTIRGHISNINYKSKWFLHQSCKEYSFEAYIHDIYEMNDNDVIKNMASELYKLNDINRQKLTTMKWTIRSFSVFLLTIAVTSLLLLISRG